MISAAMLYKKLVDSGTGERKLRGVAERIEADHAKGVKTPVQDVCDIIAANDPGEVTIEKVNSLVATGELPPEKARAGRLIDKIIEDELTAPAPSSDKSSKK